VELRTTEVRQCWNSALGIAATTAAVSPAIHRSLIIIIRRYVVLLIASSKKQKQIKFQSSILYVFPAIETVIKTPFITNKLHSYIIYKNRKIIFM